MTNKCSVSSMQQCLETICKQFAKHYTHAVAIKRRDGKRKRKQVIVDHVPLRLPRIFHLFLKHGGQISVQVTGKRRNKGIGLEIPATYTFCHRKESKILELKEAS